MASSECFGMMNGQEEEAYIRRLQKLLSLETVLMANVRRFSEIPWA